MFFLVSPPSEDCCNFILAYVVVNLRAEVTIVSITCTLTSHVLELINYKFLWTLPAAHHVFYPKDCPFYLIIIRRKPVLQSYMIGCGLSWPVSISASSEEIRISSKFLILLLLFSNFFPQIHSDMFSVL